MSFGVFAEKVFLNTTPVKYKIAHVWSPDPNRLSNLLYNDVVIYKNTLYQCLADKKSAYFHYPHSVIQACCRQIAFIPGTTNGRNVWSPLPYPEAPLTPSGIAPTPLTPAKPFVQPLNCSSGSFYPITETYEAWDCSNETGSVQYSEITLANVDHADKKDGRDNGLELTCDSVEQSGLDFIARNCSNESGYVKFSEIDF